VRRRGILAFGLVLAAMVGALATRALLEPDPLGLTEPDEAWPSQDELRACPSRVDPDVDDSGGLRAPVRLAEAVHGHRAWATYRPGGLVEPRLARVAGGGDLVAEAAGLLDAAEVEPTLGAEAADPPLDGDVRVDLGVLDRAHGESQRGATVSLLVSRYGGVELGVSERPDGSWALVACLPPAEEEGVAQLQRYLRRTGQDLSGFARSLREDPEALDDLLAFDRLDVD
jgi:hypothetical protein